MDRQHGTELCVIEQIEHLVRDAHWTIDVYSQKLSGVNAGVPANQGAANSPDAILWHRVPRIPGPHLLNYLWWFGANHWTRWRARRRRVAHADLIYAPGINCLDADVIAVHIVFHALYQQMRAELSLRLTPITGWPRLAHRKLYYRLLMYLESRIYKDKTVHLIAVSDLIAAKLKAFFGRCDVVVIPNGVDSRFHPAACLQKRAEARNAFSLLDNQFLLLLIGNDWRNKGLVVLLRALAQLRDLSLKLLVVGDDDPRPYSPVIRELALQSDVHFSPTSPDVIRFYAACDLYVGPSLEDSFGLPIIEAMACGKPVIASSHAGASEMVQDGSTGLILRDPRDPTELAVLIRRVCSDQTLRYALGAAASEYVRQNCTWQKNAERTRALLETVLRERNPHGRGV